MAAAPNREGRLRALLVRHIHDLLAQLATRPELAGVHDTAAAADEFFEVYLAVTARTHPRGIDL